MLEHVTVNQTRFVAPGLGSDARGVAVGRYCLVLLAGIDRVVGLLRGLSARGNTDDLFSALRILQVRTPLRSREFLVQLPLASSSAGDGIAAVATLMGGLTFTGSMKHFVQFRDAGSPLGYDVDALYAATGDFILYACDFVQAYVCERELPLWHLVLSLSLERDRSLTVERNDPLLIRVVPGLFRTTIGYLHRNHLQATVAACQAERTGEGPGRRFYLIRCQLPERIVALFQRTPGISVHYAAVDNVAVELGYRHPFELSACTTVFEPSARYLFSAQPPTLEVLRGALEFVDVAAVIGFGADDRPITAIDLAAAAVERVHLPLRLVASVKPRRQASAARIPASQAGYLKKLVYLLPPAALESYRVCATMTHIYLYNETDVAFIPLGELYYRVAPNVHVPLGYDLLPRVHPEILSQHLAHGGRDLLFFVADGGGPFTLPESAFVPLSRQAVANLPLRTASPVDTSIPGEDRSALLINDGVRTFPLWGFASRRENE